eukprot:5174214-Prymnesium_polylepis.1
MDDSGGEASAMDAATLEMKQRGFEEQYEVARARRGRRATARGRGGWWRRRGCGRARGRRGGRPCPDVHA